jgi:hypothetical protein
MNRSRFNELAIGDVVIPRKSNCRYRVTRFDRRGRSVDVVLEPVVPGSGLTLLRPMTAMVNSWRLVSEAPETR